MNLFLDAPIPQPCAVIAASPVIPENWLRGQFNITCANGPRSSSTSSSAAWNQAKSA